MLSWLGIVGVFVLHCVVKKYSTQPSTLILTVVVRLQYLLVLLLLSKYAIKKINFPPFNVHVHTLPWLTNTLEITNCLKMQIAPIIGT